MNILINCTTIIYCFLVCVLLMSASLLLLCYNVMERVAIPLYNGRVSPVFDTATQVLVAACGARQYYIEKTLSLKTSDPAQRCRCLAENGITVILCGGISRRFLAYLRKYNIVVHSFLSGPIPQILRTYVRDFEHLQDHRQIRQRPQHHRRRRTGHRMQPPSQKKMESK